MAQGVWDHEIVASNGPSAERIWHGFLTRGCRRTAPPQHDFGGNVCFLPQPFLGVPRPEQWQELLGRILDLHAAHGIDLLVLDPLAPLFRAENNPHSIFETLLPLTALTRRGLAILATHHPTKGQPLLGQAARGSGALLGHVDISIEMRHPGSDHLTRRRRFLALSRHAETPRQLLLELNADGSDDSVPPDEAIDPFQASWPIDPAQPAGVGRQQEVHGFLPQHTAIASDDLFERRDGSLVQQDVSSASFPTLVRAA